MTYFRVGHTYVRMNITHSIRTSICVHTFTCMLMYIYIYIYIYIVIVIVIFLVESFHPIQELR